LVLVGIRLRWASTPPGSWAMSATGRARRTAATSTARSGSSLDYPHARSVAHRRANATIPRPAISPAADRLPALRGETRTLLLMAALCMLKSSTCTPEDGMPWVDEAYVNLARACTDGACPTAMSSVYESEFSFWCPHGYIRVSGNVPGLGAIEGRGGGESVADCSICAELCSSFPACVSFECSLTQVRFHNLMWPGGQMPSTSPLEAYFLLRPRALFVILTRFCNQPAAMQLKQWRYGEVSFKRRGLLALPEGKGQ